MSYLRIKAEQCAEGFTQFNGDTFEHGEYEILSVLDDGYVQVVDPWQDELQHWAVTPDEVEVEERQGSTTPIPWTRTIRK